MFVSLTKRKIDFIKALITLSEKENGPVHYIDVANMMGVSKWTAYDVLSELEKLGYVKRKYINDENTMGRSVLLYSPEKSSYDLLDKNYLNEWNKVKEVLLNIIKKNDESKVIENFLNGNIVTIKPLKFCAYVLTTLLLKVKTFDISTLENIKNSLANINTETSLIFFVGLVIGILINYQLKNDNQKIIKKINAFHEYIRELSNGDKILLNNFLKESFLYI